MNAPDIETNQAQSVTSTNQVTDTFNVMFELWEAAAPHLDREALEWFADATGQAEYVASNLQDVVEGVGCLVAYDKEAGNFQSGDGFLSLMVTITNSLANIRGLMLVGDSASHRLRRPELFR